MRNIIVEVSGGVVQEVYCDGEDLRVLLVDWDAGESPGDAFEGGVFPVRPTADLSHVTREAIASFQR